MNKPICLTIDKATKGAPFDLNVVNHHAYVSDLRPWILPAEVEKLAVHIRESATGQENALWKYFALRISAEPTESNPNQNSELSLLRMEIEALRKETRSNSILPLSSDPSLAERIMSWADQLGLKPLKAFVVDERRAHLSIGRQNADTNDAMRALTERLQNGFGLTLTIEEHLRDSPAAG